MGTTLLSDAIRPIADEDPFGQRPASNTLSLAVESLPAPACLALYGGWGAGKTTLLRDLYERSDRERRVWFDPWLYERRDDVITPLLTAIVQTLTQYHAQKSGDIRKKAGALLKVLATLTARGAWGALVGEGFLKALENLDPIKDGQDALTKLGEVHDAVRHARDRFRELVETVCPEQSQRLLICLDDLDRCLPASVVKLVEAVKLLLCGADSYTYADPNRPMVQCRAIFVFALDRQIVGEAIREQYRGASLYTGENYLEKIFDFSLEAPPVTQDQLKQFVWRQLDEAEQVRIQEAFGAGGTFKVLDGLAQILTMGPFANPRVTLRIINRLKLLLADPARVEMLGKAVKVGADAKRFLTWLAGVERYRTFRHFFRRASEGELFALRQHCLARLSRTERNQEPTTEVLELVNTPGFLQFVLEIADKSLSFEQQRDVAEWRPGTQLSKLLHFDDVLRRAGL